jgi:hypothetical protein
MYYILPIFVSVIVTGGIIQDGRPGDKPISFGNKSQSFLTLKHGMTLRMLKLSLDPPYCVSVHASCTNVFVAGLTIEFDTRARLVEVRDQAGRPLLRSGTIILIRN